MPPSHVPASLEKTTIGTLEAPSSETLRGSYAPAREALRIPSPPPIPTPKPAPTARTRRGTNPGLGTARDAILQKPKSTPPPAPKHSTPSLLTTQVGLGAVRVDAAGNIAAPLSPERRFLVRPGERKGEIILTVLPEGVTPPSTVMSVRLQIDKDDEARALGTLLA